MQSWPDVEHIVIDGASTDGTLDVIGDFRDRLACVVSEPDRGIYDAMNKGVRRATGDVICFLNADDVYATPDVLHSVAQYMQQQELDMLFGDVTFSRVDALESTVRRYSSHQFRPDRIEYGWMPAHPALFMKRHIFDQFGYFRTDYKIAGDFEFIARIFSKANLRYLYIQEVFVRMRVGGVSTSGFRSKILLNKEVLRACRENNIRTNIFKILSKYPAKFLELIRK